MPARPAGPVARVALILPHRLPRTQTGALDAPKSTPEPPFALTLADAAPGFRWRLQTEEGNATGIQAFTWARGEGAGVIVNMSVWASVEDLAAFVFSGDHRAVLRRRREWFLPMLDAVTALWWVPAVPLSAPDDWLCPG